MFSKFNKQKFSSNQKLILGILVFVVIALVVLIFLLSYESNSDNDSDADDVSADFIITKTDGKGVKTSARIICPNETVVCIGLSEALSDTAEKTICKEWQNLPPDAPVSSNAPCTKIVIKTEQEPIALDKELPKNQACTMLYGGPEVYRIQGTIEGRPVDFKRDMNGGCQIAESERWEKLLLLASQEAL